MEKSISVCKKCFENFVLQIIVIKWVMEVQKYVGQSLAYLFTEAAQRGTLLVIRLGVFFR